MVEQTGTSRRRWPRRLAYTLILVVVAGLTFLITALLMNIQ